MKQQDYTKFIFHLEDSVYIPRFIANLFLIEPGFYSLSQSIEIIRDVNTKFLSNDIDFENTEILVISGDDRSGKDSLAKHFKNNIVKYSNSIICGFADYLKCLIYLSFDNLNLSIEERIVLINLIFRDEEIDTENVKFSKSDIRSLYVFYGEKLGKQFYGESIWVDMLSYVISIASYSRNPVIITDLRFDVEREFAQRFKNRNLIEITVKEDGTRSYSTGSISNKLFIGDWSLEQITKLFSNE